MPRDQDARTVTTTPVLLTDSISSGPERGADVGFAALDRLDQPGCTMITDDSCVMH
jgi:hypothetical protein